MTPFEYFVYGVTAMAFMVVGWHWNLGWWRSWGYDWAEEQDRKHGTIRDRFKDGDEMLKWDKINSSKFRVPLLRKYQMNAICEGVTDYITDKNRRLAAQGH